MVGLDTALRLSRRRPGLWLDFGLRLGLRRHGLWLHYDLAGGGMACGWTTTLPVAAWPAALAAVDHNTWLSGVCV